MPKLKAGTILPTPAEDAAISAAAEADPDARPYTEAEWALVRPQVRRGRPLGSATKAQVTLRLDADLVARFRASGPGWQTRINAVLREALAQGIGGN